MILGIARKEFVDAWRDGRFRLGAALVLVLLLVSGLLARQQVARAQGERDAATALERKNWLEQGDKNSHSAGHYGVNVFKPTSPLAVFDRGIEPFVGTSVFLEAHRQNQAAFLPAQDATAMRRFGELSAAVALQMLVPLLIVLLAFGALAGERESGTLRQILSLGVRPRQLVLGKALGLGATVAVLLLPAAGVMAFLLARAAGPEATGLWARAGGLALSYSAYLAIFVALSVAVSASTRTSRTALTILLSIWALNCIVAPRLASDVIHQSLPTPKLAEFEAEMQKGVMEGLDGHDPRNKRLADFQRDTLAKHGKTRVEDLPFNFQGLVMLESERIAGEVFDFHFGKLWDRIQAQDRAVALAGVGAPMLALRSASMAFAGTDFAHHRHFAVSAEQHRREFVRVLNEDLMNNARPGDHRYAAGRALWEQLPVFRLEPLPVHDAWGAARAGVLVLAGWLLAALGTLFFSAGRLRVVNA
ncbi:MAG: DUF3526 domain-containing protein [Planctomycetota bacterium]|nr:DUF3526 domain-containing protein [Planctomycetota bacterium]